MQKVWRTSGCSWWHQLGADVGVCSLPCWALGPHEVQAPFHTAWMWVWTPVVTAVCNSTVLKCKLILLCHWRSFWQCTWSKVILCPGAGWAGASPMGQPFVFLEQEPAWWHTHFLSEFYCCSPWMLDDVGAIQTIRGPQLRHRGVCETQPHGQQRLLGLGGAPCDRVPPFGFPGKVCSVPGLGPVCPRCVHGRWQHRGPAAAHGPCRSVVPSVAGGRRSPRRLRMKAAIRRWGRCWYSRSTSRGARIWSPSRRSRSATQTTAAARRPRRCFTAQTTGSPCAAAGTRPRGEPLALPSPRACSRSPGTHGGHGPARWGQSCTSAANKRVQQGGVRGITFFFVWHTIRPFKTNLFFYWATGLVLEHFFF